MPITTRVFVKASILYLILGAALGALLLINGWLPLGSAIYYLKPAHVQFLVVGWLTQFILGVAWWLFPPLAFRLRGRDYPHGQAQRGSEPLFWLTFALLNAGVLLNALGEPLYRRTDSGLFGGLVALSSLCLLAAA
ncbi:MAG: hypothetical protein JXM73_18420, partial [Anaerolineae bacterium]|nr:hypothetical protein [Anaerolineae bacterium]